MKCFKHLGEAITYIGIENEAIRLIIAKLFITKNACLETQK